MMTTMVRWEPGAADRLRAAALELFEERGYEQTTVAAIAERAGVTERTFYRYFADKREVLFAGSEQLQERAVEALAAAPIEAGPGELVTAALDGLAASFPAERRPYSRRRQAALESVPALQERELLKLASLRAALIDAFIGRGLAAGAAAVAAEATLGVFHVAFTRWIAVGEERGFAELQHAAAEEFRSVIGTA
jgi:AcrR family transcriptional regulator